MTKREQNLNNFSMIFMLTLWRLTCHPRRQFIVESKTGIGSAHDDATNRLNHNKQFYPHSPQITFFILYLIKIDAEWLFSDFSELYLQPCSLSSIANRENSF